jgi:hypothetical protein
VANTLLEAIMKGLAQAAGGVGQQIQQRDLLNTERQDQWRRLMGDRRKDKQDQAWREKVFEAEQQNRKEDRRQNYMYRTAGNLDAAAESVAGRRHQENTLAETIRHNREAESIDRSREGRLANPLDTMPGSVPPAQRGAVHAAWLEATRIPDPTSTSGGTIAAPWTGPRADSSQTFMSTGRFPVGQPTTTSWHPPMAQFANPQMSAVYGLNKPDQGIDEWGRSEYGEDWGLLTPEQKQALARKNGKL